MAASSEWIGVAGALGGVAITGAIGLGTAVLNHRWTSAARDRDRADARADATLAAQKEAYVRYLSAHETLGIAVLSTFMATEWQAVHRGVDVMQQLAELRAEEPKVFDEYDSAKASAQLVCGPAVSSRLESVDEDLFAVATAAAQGEQVGASDRFSELIEAMRLELQTAGGA